MKYDKIKVGVIIGRFQVPELTEGHKEIFDYVLSKGYDKNIVILGIAPTKATKTNPLDFDSRRKMIIEAYPNMFDIMYLKDDPSDEEWSKKLDKTILENIERGNDVILYGNKDSFINHYVGSLKTEEYIQKITCSEAEERFYTGRKAQNNADWRAGVMWATQNRYDTVYPTVDCAIFDDDKFKYMYMAKKEDESLLRFVGGFADPNDNSFEEAAIREAKEETGLNCKIISWVGSSKIDDFRYRFESDKVITNFFALKKESGIASANDDIKELHRVDIDSLSEDNIIKEHRVLFNKLKDWIKEENSTLKVCNSSIDTDEFYENSKDSEYTDENIDMFSPETHLVGEIQGYEIWYVDSVEISKFLGSNYKNRKAKWCISIDQAEYYWNDYKNDTFYFLIRKEMQGNRFDKIAFEYKRTGTMKCWDINNRIFTTDDYEGDVGLIEYMKENFKWIDKVSDEDKYFLNPITIIDNKDGTVNIDGNLYLDELNLNEFPWKDKFKIRELFGSLYIQGNNFENLDGCPEIIHGDFDCSNNPMSTKIENLNINLPKVDGFIFNEEN